MPNTPKPMSTVVVNSLTLNDDGSVTVGTRMLGAKSSGGPAPLTPARGGSPPSFRAESVSTAPKLGSVLNVAYTEEAAA